MSDTMRWAFVGDLQIPYHDKRAVGLFFDIMKEWKPNVIDVIGDIDDQLEYSNFSDGTTDEFFNQLAKNQKENEKLLALHNKQKEKAEADPSLDFDAPAPELVSVDPMPFVKANAEGARRFYEDLRADHKDAEIHASLGNHDIRIFKYMNKKAPEYWEQVTPNMLWSLDDFGISWRMYHEPPLERYAGIHVHHGDTTTTTGLAVKNDIENYGISLVRGHDHRGGVVYKSYPLNGRSLAGMGCGHLCDPGTYGLQYTINPAWEQGFGIAHVVDGKAHLQFVPMRDYTVILDGRVFKG